MSLYPDEPQPPSEKGTSSGVESPISKASKRKRPEDINIDISCSDASSGKPQSEVQNEQSQLTFVSGPGSEGSSNKRQKVD